MTPTEIIAAAAVKADRINDLLSKGMVIGGERLWIISELLREHNRLSWAWVDLQEAGVEETVWLPVRVEAKAKVEKFLEEAKQGRTPDAIT